MRLPGLVALALLAGSLTSCERDPLELLCDPQASGAVVITEISGKQSGAEVAEQWIELYNTTGAAIPLNLATFVMTSLDGSSSKKLILRQPDAVIEPRTYRQVLWTEAAPGAPGALVEEYVTALFADALMELQLCNETVDRIIYYNLPKKGALALDGALEPTAEANDDVASWCVDQGEPIDGAVTLPGTPGARNRPCD